MHYLINYGIEEYNFKEKNLYIAAYSASHWLIFFFYTLTDFDNISKCPRQLTLGAWLYQN